MKQEDHKTAPAERTGHTGRRATTRDVARVAGVSAATVSRVFNGEAQVSANTRQRVLAAVDTLHYEPVRTPRTATQARSGWIAFAYRNKSVSSFINALQTGAIDRCMASGVMLSSHACQFTGSELRQELQGLVTHLQPKGVVLTPPLSVQPGARELLRQQQTPYVRLCPQEDDDLAPRVWFDERAAMRAMVSHLLELGHRRLAMIVGLPLDAPDARREGYLDAIRQARAHSAERDIVCGRYDFSEAQAHAQRLLQRRSRPTAVVCSSDEMAAAVMQVAHELGLRVPDDVSVTGFDDSSLAAILVPALTTIHAPLEEMGAAAVDLLMKGPPDMQAGIVLSRPWKLVLRQSTAAVPASVPASSSASGAE